MEQLLLFFPLLLKTTEMLFMTDWIICFWGEAINAVEYTSTVSEQSSLLWLTEAWWRSNHKILEGKGEIIMAPTFYSTSEHNRLVQTLHFTSLPGIKCAARPVAKSILTLLASYRCYPALLLLSLPLVYLQLALKDEDRASITELSLTNFRSC